ncbi:MAG: hypothetical protein HQM13_22400 [SAR324 cluster bacterium]|nr:hypothetical protein [SAR324 cluster bacterium]
MKNVDVRERLMQLDQEQLADALLELAQYIDEASNLVERLIASPKENVSRFKKRLSALKRRTRFIHWGQSRDFARELEGLLTDLEAGVQDPVDGVKLVISFYENDSSIMEMCDDSSGWVGEVFSFNAQDLFVKFASKCTDQKWLIKQLVSLYAKDDYGVRSNLINRVCDFLSDESVRQLVEFFWKEVDGCADHDYRQRHWLYGIESIAKQLKDAPLYEKASLRVSPELPVASCIDIGQVYLDSGDANTALKWVEKIPEDNNYRNYEKDRLLLAVYKELGEQEKRAEVAWRIFQGYRSDDNFAQLLEIIGEDQREKVIQEQCSLIMSKEKFSHTDAEFLIHVELITEADTYILLHREQLDGNFYSSILPLAESMEQHNQYLSASVMYRVLLDSILKRAVSKYYHHGVRYLKKLDQLAPHIEDWKEVESHQMYFEQMRQRHGRKSSFWSKYRNKK